MTPGLGRTVRWGVIGATGIARRRTIPEALRIAANAKLVAVMSRDAGRAQDVAAEFGVPHWCTTIDELLRHDLDMVYIGTPQHLHCEQVLQVAAAGKHVLCEKPLAVSLAEVKQLKAACQSARVKLMVAFCMRNNVYNAKARELVQAGALGQMVMGRAQLTCWYPPIPGAWRQDATVSRGGSLIDMGTHCLDLLEWVMGAEIVEVVGFQDLMTHAYPTRIEDASTVLVRLSNGAHGIVDNYFNLPDAAAQNALELHGTKGSIIAQGTIGQDPTGRMFSIIQPQETGYDASQVRDRSSEREEYHLPGEGIYGVMIRDFCQSILDDVQPPVSLGDGERSVRLVQAIYRAVSERRVVRLDEVVSP